MRTLNVSISDKEYKRYGIKKDNLTLADFLDLVNRRNFRGKLKRSVEFAEQCGLSSMTMDEITEEVKAVRNAKNRH